MAATPLLFRPDEQADSPLWTEDGRPVDLGELPLPGDLRRMLEHWNGVAGSAADLDDGELAHVVEFGRTVFEQVVDQLGDDYEVRWDWAHGA